MWKAASIDIPDHLPCGNSSARDRHLPHSSAHGLAVTVCQLSWHFSALFLLDNCKRLVPLVLTSHMPAGTVPLPSANASHSLSSSMSAEHAATFRKVTSDRSPSLHSVHRCLSLLCH